MISNEEAFIKGDIAARQKEEQLGRKLTLEEYETFVIWYMNKLQNPYLYELSFEPNFDSN